jgi:N-acetylglutamate synthase
VVPEHRGQGHATAMMAALLEWGAEQGATTVWLHVETDNLPALRLYDGLGFVTHHTNRYLAASP